MRTGVRRVPREEAVSASVRRGEQRLVSMGVRDFWRKMDVGLPDRSF